MQPLCCIDLHRQCMKIRAKAESVITEISCKAYISMSSVCEHTGNLVHLALSRWNFAMLVSFNLLFQGSGPDSLITAMLAHQFAWQEFFLNYKTILLTWKWAVFTWQLLSKLQNKCYSKKWLPLMFQQHSFMSREQRVWPLADNNYDTYFSWNKFGSPNLQLMVYI